MQKNSHHKRKADPDRRDLEIRSAWRRRDRQSSLFRLDRLCSKHFFAKRRPNEASEFFSEKKLFSFSGKVYRAHFAPVITFQAKCSIENNMISFPLFTQQRKIHTQTATHPLLLSVLSPIPLLFPSVTSHYLWSDNETLLLPLPILVVGSAEGG